MLRYGESVFVNSKKLLCSSPEHKRLSIRHLINSPWLRHRHASPDGKILAGDNIQLIEPGIRREKELAGLIVEAMDHRSANRVEGIGNRGTRYSKLKQSACAEIP